MTAGIKKDKSIVTLKKMKHDKIVLFSKKVQIDQKSSSLNL